MGSPIKMTGMIVKVLFITGNKQTNKQTNKTGKRYQYHVLWACLRFIFTPLGRITLHEFWFRWSHAPFLLALLASCKNRIQLS